ncbi:alpha/beta fold hydrolase [Helicovermis profundi]|uniref:alpha/beta fold hydrolase n=1 Tax=Helicovermis profundi TaxID=3065157 RepID=UPI0030D4F395
MNIIEILIAFVLFFIYVFKNLRNIFFDKAFIGFIFLSFVSVYLIIYDTFRWQLIPLILLIIITYILLIYIGFIYKNKNLKVSHKLSRRIVTVLIASFLFSSIIFPLNDFKIYKGKYYVGNKIYTMIDPLRKEILSKNENRKISVKLYYPSDSISKERNRWIDNIDGLEKYIFAKYKIPKFFVSYIGNIKTNSYKNVEVSNNVEKMPVVIISHGFASLGDFQTSLAEKLASNGYLVAVINHTYGSIVTNIDNKNIYLDDNLFSNDDLDYFSFGKNIIDIYKKDIMLTIEGLKKLNSVKSNLDFKNKIDVNNIALLGHSIGGSAALLLEKDDRVKSVIALDPWIEPISSKFVKYGFNKPTSVLISDEWYNSENTRYIFRICEINNCVNSKVYKVNKFSHQDFTDLGELGLMSKLFKISKTDNYNLNHKKNNAFILNYFDYYLLKKNTESKLMSYINENNDIFKAIGVKK